jgi:hypothetical protein
VNLAYTGDSCDRGNYSLNLYNFGATQPALSVAALNAGVFRLADIPEIAAQVQGTLSTATCNGETLLLTLPKVWSLNGAINGFGIAVVTVMLIAIFVSMILLWTYRARTVLRSSSVPFLALILVGLALMLASILPLVQTVSTQSCTAFVWLVNLGFTCVVSSERAARPSVAFAARVGQIVSRSVSLLFALSLLSALLFFSLFLSSPRRGAFIASSRVVSCAW